MSDNSFLTLLKFVFDMIFSFFSVTWNIPLTSKVTFGPVFIVIVLVFLVCAFIFRRKD